jgi:hypothetical protein
MRPGIGLENGEAIADLDQPKASVCAIGGAGIVPSIKACIICLPVMPATSSGFAVP